MFDELDEVTWPSAIENTIRRLGPYRDSGQVTEEAAKLFQWAVAGRYVDEKLGEYEDEEWQ